MIGLVAVCRQGDRRGRHQSGDIFSDDFKEDSSDGWLDMKVWGFGVWQTEDGTFVSLDRSNPTQGIYSAAPRLDNAILNRDFSVVLRMKPVGESNLTFSMNVRQEGWSQYKIEITKDGIIFIKKSVLGLVDETLFTSKPGRMVWDTWQWLRLDVRGEAPLSIRVKLWTGNRQDEPEFYDAVAVDPRPLKPTNMAVAINTIQDSGAYVIIDDFDIYSLLKASRLWKWIDLKNEDVSVEHANKRFREAFNKGKLYESEAILRYQFIGNVADYEKFNNLAVIRAEADDFEGALQWIDQAFRLQPGDSVVTHNLKWIWYGICVGGLVQPLEDEVFPHVFIRLDRKVYEEPARAEFDLGLFHPLFDQSDVSLKLKITLINTSGREVWSRVRSCQSNGGSFEVLQEAVDLAHFEDGLYTAKVHLKDGNGQAHVAETRFEIIHQDYQDLRKRYLDLHDEIQKNFQHSVTNAKKQDWANLKVELLPVEKGFRGVEQPGMFQLFRKSIEEGLDKVENLALSIRNGKQPFHHKTGSFLRGYYSDIDGSVQGYAIYVPETYDLQDPFPMVINLHGYDPSFSGWKDNPFLPAFTPHMTEHARYIVVSPFGRSNTFYQNLGENDVLNVLREVRRLYSIDENRIYLTGGSMGGAGTWHIGLHYPHLFAAIAPIMGPTELGFWMSPDPDRMTEIRKFILAKNSAVSVAENAHHLPMYCNHGVLDDIVPVEQSRQMVKRIRDLGYDIKYIEHPEAMHGGFDPEMDHAIYDWFETFRKDLFPKRVVFKTADLRHGGAYWVNIERFIDLLKFATIDVEITGPNSVNVKTDNVNQFRLRFPEELFDHEKPVTITVNDQICYENFIPGDKALTLSAHLSETESVETWGVEDTSREPALGKRPGLGGPILDAMNSGFLLIYGSIGSETETAVNREEAEIYSRQWSSWQHVPCRIKMDTRATAEDIQKYNVVLIGNPGSNAVFKRIQDDLPIQIQEEAIVLGNHRYSGEHVGLAMIYPNPLNQNRYVVVLSGSSWKGTSGVMKRIGSEFDYIIFDERTLGINLLQGNISIDGTSLLCGFFDQNWQISEKYQWSGEDKMRDRILPRKIPQKHSPDPHDKMAYLSDFVPAEVDLTTGLVEYDRNFWGLPFRAGGKKYEKGIGLFPHATLVYRLDGKWNTFSAILSADLNSHSGLKKTEYEGGKIQFGIYGDGHELLVSRAMDVRSKPQKINISVTGIKELKLVVRTQDWLPYFAQSASWVDARLMK